MLKLCNNSNCWESPKVTYPVLLKANIQNSQGILKFTEAKNFLELSHKDFHSKTYKQIKGNDLILQTVQELIDKEKTLKNDETGYLLYEILGLKFWNLKEYDQSTIWLRKGIEKGEPSCMHLLEKLDGITIPKDIEELRKNLRISVENRIQKLKQKDIEFENSYKTTLERLQIWLETQTPSNEYSAWGLPLILTSSIISAIIILILPSQRSKYEYATNMRLPDYEWN